MLLRNIVAAFLIMAATTSNVFSQELYVFTEPASNMPSKAIGIRVTHEGMFNPDFRSRIFPEVMIGFNKDLMTHTQLFFSDMDGNYRYEGASLYAKYRFLSIDGLKKHFRMAVFGRISYSKRPTYTSDINLEGDNSGYQGGLVATQLLKKLAISTTIGYSEVFKSVHKKLTNFPQPDNLLSYSLSAGYLVLPITYKNYNQPNLNAYVELLGTTDPSDGKSYLDIAPALQVVLNSTTRIDLGYRWEIAGGMQGRYNKNMYLLRAEFNFFNILK